MTIWNLVSPGIELGFLETDIVVPSFTTILDPNRVTGDSILDGPFALCRLARTKSSQTRVDASHPLQGRSKRGGTRAIHPSIPFRSPPTNTRRKPINQHEHGSIRADSDRIHWHPM